MNFDVLLFCGRNRRNIRLCKVFGSAIILAAILLFAGCASIKGLFSRFGSKPEAEVDTVITYDASTLKNVIRISDDGVEKAWLAVTADGTKLLYCEQPVEMDLSANTRNYSSRIMYLKNSSVFMKTPLTESFTLAPAWYEDGERFVYLSRNDNGVHQLIRSNVNGGAKVLITRNPIGQRDDHPTIQGDTIALDTYIDINRGRQIVTLKDNGTEITILGPGECPSWHPTEPKIAFQKEDGIWEMDTTTAQQSQIYTVSKDDKEQGITCYYPHYTTDGKHILFIKKAKIGNFLYWHLFRVRTEDGVTSQLTEGRVNVVSIALAADNKIFFIANASGKYEIWSATVATE
jgi:Tol biopolymer transport system component